LHGIFSLLVIGFFHPAPDYGLIPELSLDSVHGLIKLLLFHHSGMGKQTRLDHSSGEPGNAEAHKPNSGFQFCFRQQFLGRMVDLMGAVGGQSQRMTASNLFEIGIFDFQGNGPAFQTILAQFPAHPFGLL
jgi:hypothetical protein